jgi:hypothetical protein
MIRILVIFLVLGVEILQAIPHKYNVSLSDHSILSNVTIINVTNDSVKFSNQYSVHIDSIVLISPDITITGVFSRIGATIGGIYGLIFRINSKHFLDDITDEPIIRYFGDVLAFSVIGGICGYVVGWIFPSEEYRVSQLQRSEKIKLIKSLCIQK